MNADELCAASRQRYLAGDLAHAEALCRSALQRDPRHADSLHLLGLLAQRDGQKDRAVELIERAVALKPRNAVYRDALGVALSLAGRNEAAISAARQAVRLDASSLPAIYNLGRALSVQGEHAEAIRCFRRAVAIDPKFAAAHGSLGNALAATGDHARAGDALRHALALEPGSAQRHGNLAAALMALGRDAEARELLEKALAIDPAYEHGLELLGQLCQRAGDFAPQEQALRRALAEAPANAALISRLAVLLDRLDRLDEAGPYFRQALDFAPRDPLCHANHAIWLRNMGDLEGAESCLRAGLKLAPADRQLHHALAHTLLSMGKLREGFAENEWRHIPARYQAPAWTGERAPDRTVLIMLGEGRGDVFQFLRYVPLAAQRVRVVLETAPALRRLMGTIPGVAQLFSLDERVPDHDMFCSMLSLPHLLGLSDAPLGMDAENPYLRPAPEDVAHWAQHLAALPGRKIGLAWAGAADFSVDRRRSIPASLLDGLRADTLSFVSLQKDAVAKPGLPLSDWTDRLRDFADTAALIANLDLVISVDTAVAHLAGAMGKPVWLLNRFDADWRWLRVGEGSAWYPTMRQFRQKRPGDWPAVIEAVRLALASTAQT